MIELPAEHTVLATFDVNLQHFTEGEFEYENTFTKDIYEKPQRISSALSERVSILTTLHNDTDRVPSIGSSMTDMNEL